MVDEAPASSASCWLPASSQAKENAIQTGARACTSYNRSVYQILLPSSPSVYLLSGNPGLDMDISLKDFDREELEPPTWLSAKKWEDVLAISVLPGALDSVCVHLAEHQEKWQLW